MIAVLTTHGFESLVKGATKEFNVVIESYSEESHKYLKNISSLKIDCLVVSKHICSDEVLLDELSELKIKNSSIRIIVLVADARSEDLFIDALIKRGIYDIFNVSNDFDAEKTVVDLKELIRGRPRKYSDTVEWQNKPSNYVLPNKNELSRKIVMFLNLTEKAGSTLLATSYADYLARKSITPALVEMPFKPDYFHQFGLELYETKRKKICSRPHNIKEDQYSSSRKPLYKRNILWLVADPRLPLIDSWNVNEMLTLLEYGNKADIIIVDAGDSYQHESIYSLLPMVDNVFAIVEPRPVSIIKSIAKIEKLKEYQQHNSRVKFILNKWDDCLLKNGFMDQINLQPNLLVPVLDKASLYKSEYNCLSAISEVKNLRKLTKPFQDISKCIWPNYNYKSVIKKESFVAEGL